MFNSKENVDVFVYSGGNHADKPSTLMAHEPSIAALRYAIGQKHLAGRCANRQASGNFAGP